MSSNSGIGSYKQKHSDRCSTAHCTYQKFVCAVQWTVVNFSSSNLNEFLIGSVHRTQLNDMGIPIKKSDGGPISTAHSECSKYKCNNSILCYKCIAMQPN